MISGEQINLTHLVCRAGFGSVEATLEGEERGWGDYSGEQIYLNNSFGP